MMSWQDTISVHLLYPNSLYEAHIDGFPHPDVNLTSKPELHSMKGLTDSIDQRRGSGYGVFQLSDTCPGD